MKRFLLLLALLLLVTGAQVAPARAQNDYDALLRSYVAADDYGVVLFVGTPDGDWVGARGLADVGAGTPVQTDDRFRIGSVTKTFVAAVTLLLADAGKLALDDPMANHLDATLTDGFEYGDEITLRHLLSHTSGIPDYLANDDFWDAVADDPTYPWTAAETIAYAAALDTAFAPGEGWQYSNTNYNLMQLVLEAVTGQTFADLLRARIFDPLDMAHSSVETTLGDDIIHGYEDFDGDGTLDDVTFVNEGNGLGDGGIISTAGDLAIFARALVAGDLLPDEWRAEMFAEVQDSDYGLGIELLDSAAGPVVGHSGATAGFLSYLYYLLDYDVVVVVLTNNLDSDTLEGLVTDAALLAAGAAQP